MFGAGDPTTLHIKSMLEPTVTVISSKGQTNFGALPSSSFLSSVFPNVTKSSLSYSVKLNKALVFLATTLQPSVLETYILLIYISIFLINKI